MNDVTRVDNHPVFITREYLDCFENYDIDGQYFASTMESTAGYFIRNLIFLETYERLEN